jgi:hypothetical protein
MNAILTVCLAFLLAGVPVARVPELMTRIDGARDALSRQEYTTAQATLNEVVAAAREAHDDVAAARALFFLGRLKQEQSQRATVDVAGELRDEATRYYEQSLVLYPKSGATLFHLAEVAAAGGDVAQARTLLNRAIALDDPRRAVFAEKLGDLAAGEGKHDDAVEAYETAVKASEPSPALRQKLIRETLADGDDPEDVLPHVWALAKSDRVDFALNATFEALASKKLDAKEADGYFGVLAYGLAHMNLSPSELGTLGLVEKLSSLAQNDDRKARASSILALYNGNVAAVRATAWPSKVNDDDVPRDLSPRNNLGELAGAIGRRALYDRDYTRADTYYELAYDLGGKSDARLLTEFATVRFAQQRFPEIEPLLATFEKSLEGQNIAARDDAEQVYEYHRAIGTMYAGMNRWTDAARPQTSALYHLENAASLGKTLHIDTPVESPAWPADGNVKRLLGDAYAVAGRTHDSTNARLDAATMFKTSGDFASVRDVVGTIPVSTLDTDLWRSKYANVVSPLVSFTGGWPEEELGSSAFVKGCLVVLATSKNPAVIADARKKLEELELHVNGTFSGTITSPKVKAPIKFSIRTRG